MVKMVAYTLLTAYLCSGEVMPISQCNETIKSLLCHKNEEYLSSEYPEPSPCQVNIIMHLKDIYNVDEEKNTISLFVRISTDWKDERITLYRDADDETRYLHF